MLKFIDQEPKEFISMDTAVDPDQALAFPTEYINNIECSGLPQHKLDIKVGAPILLMTNLDV